MKDQKLVHQFKSAIVQGVGTISVNETYQLQVDLDEVSSTPPHPTDRLAPTHMTSRYTLRRRWQWSDQIEVTVWEHKGLGRSAVLAQCNVEVHDIVASSTEPKKAW